MPLLSVSFPCVGKWHLEIFAQQSARADNGPGVAPAQLSVGVRGDKMYAGHFAVGLAIKFRFPHVQTFPIMLGVDTLFGVPDTQHI